jgi:riboflavin synthase
MFTGLVECVGKLSSREVFGNGVTLWVDSSLPLEQVSLGDSIACDGVCLTVEKIEDSRFRVMAGVETMECTTLGGWSVGRPVHIERALAAGDRFGGHMVSGHVDGVGEVVSADVVDESVVVWMEVPADLAKYVAPKGSIAVDGVSLTVNEVDGSRFRVNLIPHTMENTHASDYKPGTKLNIEVDLVARYVERIMSCRGAETTDGE